MKIILSVITVLGLWLLWYLRTWFHGIGLFFYATPVIWQVLLLTLLIHYAVLKRIPVLTRSTSVKIEDTVEITPLSIITPLLFVALLVPGLVFSSIARQVDLAQTVTYAFRDTLPESTGEVRLMPYHVARRYAIDSLQLSQYKLGTENIGIIDGRLHWMFPLTPDGLVITFLRQNKGVVSVDATTQAKNTSHSWQDMAIGEGMQIRDNLYWNLYRQRYFVTLDDPYYVPVDDEIYTVVGAVDYRFRMRWGLLYTVPEFSGVFVVDTAGDIDFVSPEDALTHPVLEHNRIFPENLTRTYVNAYQYHLGAVNKFFIHEDQIQIQDVRSPGTPVNRQPFLMDTDEGLKWFISTEPYGASHGIFKIFVVDAQTGQIEIYELPPDKTYTGPVRAVDYVRRANPIVDWSRFDSVEPLPFVKDQTLYWKLTVIPADAAGIAYQVFVDASTNDVIELHTNEEIHAFVTGDPVRRTVERTAEPGDDVFEQMRLRLQELESLLERLEQSR